MSNDESVNLSHSEPICPACAKPYSVILYGGTSDRYCHPDDTECVVKLEGRGRCPFDVEQLSKANGTYLTPEQKMSKEFESLDAGIRAHGGVVIHTIDQMIPLLAKMQMLLSRKSDIKWKREMKEELGLPQWSDYLEGIAEEFGISKRTIQRRLHDLDHPDEEDGPENEDGEDEDEGDEENRDSGSNGDDEVERRSQFDSEMIADAGIRMANDVLRNALVPDMSESSRLKRVMAHAEHLMSLVMEKDYAPLPSATAIKKDDTLLFELQTGTVNDAMQVNPTAFRVVSVPNSWGEDTLAQPFPWSRNCVYRVKGDKPGKRYANIILEVIS